MAKKKKKLVDKPTRELSFITLVPQIYAAQLRCLRREWEQPDSYQWNWVSAYYFQSVLIKIPPIRRSELPKLLAFGEAIARVTPMFRVNCRGLERDSEGRQLFTRLEANSSLEELHGRLDRPLRANGLLTDHPSNPFEIVVATRFDNCPGSVVTPAENLSSMDWGRWVVSKFHLVEARDGHGPLACTILHSFELPKSLT